MTINHDYTYSGAGGWAAENVSNNSSSTAAPSATAAAVPVITPAGTTLEQLERQAIQDALDRCSGHRKQAAEQLGIGLRTLYDKLKQYKMS